MVELPKQGVEMLNSALLVFFSCVQDDIVDKLMIFSIALYFAVNN